MKKLCLMLLSLTTSLLCEEERSFFALIVHAEPAEKYDVEVWNKCEQLMQTLADECNASQDNSPEAYITSQNRAVEVIQDIKNLCTPESNITLHVTSIRKPIVLPEAGIVVAFEYLEDSNVPAEQKTIIADLQKEIETEIAQDATQIRVLSKLEPMFRNFTGNVTLSL